MFTGKPSSVSTLTLPASVRYPHQQRAHSQDTRGKGYPRNSPAGRRKLAATDAQNSEETQNLLNYNAPISSTESLGSDLTLGQKMSESESTTPLIDDVFQQHTPLHTPSHKIPLLSSKPKSQQSTPPEKQYQNSASTSFKNFLFRNKSQGDEKAMKLKAPSMCVPSKNEIRTANHHTGEPQPYLMRFDHIANTVVPQDTQNKVSKSRSKADEKPAAQTPEIDNVYNKRLSASKSMPMTMDNHLVLNYANSDPKDEVQDIINMQTFATIGDSPTSRTANESMDTSCDHARDQLDNSRDATETDEENNVKSRFAGRSLDSDITYMDDQQ